MLYHRIFIGSFGQFQAIFLHMLQYEVVLGRVLPGGAVALRKEPIFGIVPLLYLKAQSWKKGCKLIC
jgi:hypothetical protein